MKRWTPFLFEYPLPVLLQHRVHGVGRQVEFARPGYGAVLYVDLTKARGIGKFPEHPGIRRVNKSAYVYLALYSIVKPHMQAKSCERRYLATSSGWLQTMDGIATVLMNTNSRARIGIPYIGHE